MSSFLCFICHSTVNADTNEEMREKYREVVGMNLCPDSHLCHICCHVMNRLWLFRSICLKRSLEYPVLFSEKGTLNLQRNDLEIHTICFEDCEHYKNRNMNSKYYHFTYFDGTFDSNEKYSIPNEYVELEDDRQEFDDFLDNKFNYNDENIKDVQNVCINDNTNYEHNEIVEETSSNEFDDNDETCTNEFNDKDNFDDEEKIKDDGNHYQENVLEGIEHKYDEDYASDDDVQSYASDEENCVKDLDYKGQPKSPNIEPNILNEEVISNHDMTNLDTELHVKKKKKKKKKEKKRFDKFSLSVEEQKGELEAKRKDKKYIEAEFKCYNCALGFLFKDTYQAHMMRHEESNGEHQCSICSLRFATMAVLRAHTALHAERHRCARCGAILRRRQRTEHARECFQLETEAASCHLCGKIFKDSNRLQQHLKRFHRAKNTGRTHTCNVCGERFGDPAAVRTHMIKHIQRKFPCDRCPAILSSPYARHAHCARHSVQRVRCACGAELSSVKGLRAHTARAKTHSEGTFPCGTCGRECGTVRALRAHVATHVATRRECPACPARYNSRKSLTRHLASHAPRPSPAPALCHLCGNSFKSNSKLNRHLKQVCEKNKLEEELSAYYAQNAVTDCGLNTG